MINPLVFKRLGDGVYATPDNSVVIRRETSDHFNGRKYVKETVWTISILKYLLPGAEMTLSDAKDEAWCWMQQATLERIDYIYSLPGASRG